MKQFQLGLSLVWLCLYGLELGSATSDNGRPSVELTQQAVQLGIKPEVFGELWKTKNPVIVSQQNPQGLPIQITYSLSPDCRQILVNEEPAETFEVSTTPDPPAAANPHSDWEYLPGTLSNRPSFPSFGSNFPSFGSGFPDWPRFDPPAGVTPEETTKTELDNQGRTVTTRTKIYRTPVVKSPSAGGLLPNWPNFSFPSGIKPQVHRKTETDDQGRTVTTTVTSYGNMPSNWSPSDTDLGFGDFPVSWPQLPSWFPTQPTFPSAQPQPQPQPQPLPQPQPQPQPLPQPQPNPQAAPTPPPLPARPVQRLPLAPTLPPNRPTEPTDDSDVPLPTVPPRNTGGLRPLELPTTTPLPSLEEFLKQSTTPQTVQAVFRSADESPSEPAVFTKVSSFRETYNGVEPPKTSDLQPQLQDILARGGITDEDIQNAKARGEDVVRTRTLPDGRTIRTTVRVNSRPVLIPQPASGATGGLPPLPVTGGTTEYTIRKSVQGYERPVLIASGASNEPTFPAAAPPTPRPEQPSQQDKTIDNFLSQVNLSPEDIEAQNGEVIKTFVDRNGRVLSARFVLSTVKGEQQGQGQAQKPTK